MLTPDEVTARLRATRDAMLADLDEAMPDLASVPSPRSHRPTRRRVVPAAASAAVAAAIAGSLAVTAQHAGTNGSGDDGGRAAPAAATSSVVGAAPGSWTEPNAAVFAGQARLTESQLAAELHQMVIAEERRRIASGEFRQAVGTFSEDNLDALEENYLINTLRYCVLVPPALAAPLRDVLASLAGPQIAREAGKVAPTGPAGAPALGVGAQISAAPGADQC